MPEADPNNRASVESTPDAESQSGHALAAAVADWKGEPGLVLVEDSLADAALIREFLKEGWTAKFEIRHFPRVTPAAEWLMMHGAACVLLDLSLPDSHLLEGLNMVMARAPGLPVVVLTGLDDEPTAVSALKIGAQDYLSKNYIDSQILNRTIRYAIERTETDARAQKSAFRDPLTGVADRRLFEDRLSQAHIRFQRTSEPYAVLFMDLDNFKQVNDTYGHAAGDAVLLETSRRIDALLRADDTLARLGGDEFVVICQSIGGEQDAARVAKRIWETVTTEPVEAQQTSIQVEIPVELSIGVAIARTPTTAPEKLMREADAAMYEAKHHSARYELARR
ncbi:MAG: diguanylate cyclase [Actinobacteria bacterium]|nr:diguanylate cyclase [Actinomycetota bacterium]